MLAPASVQEAVDLMALAFDLAEVPHHRDCGRRRHLGQMMEPVELPPMRDLPAARPDWALTGALGRPRASITSLYLGAETLEEHNLRLQAKLARIQAAEVALRDDA